jgi:hypothetical protein
MSRIYCTYFRRNLLPPSSGVSGSSEMVANVYQITRRHVPEHMPTYRRENPKFRINLLVYFQNKILSKFQSVDLV